jgi:hypothetical protein
MHTLAEHAEREREREQHITHLKHCALKNIDYIPPSLPPIPSLIVLYTLRKL